MNRYEEVKNYIEQHRGEMLEMWRDFVETPSQARDRSAAMKMKEKLMDIFARMGMMVKEYDVGPSNSQIIEAVLGPKRRGKPILFTGHYDTVNCSPVEDAEPGDKRERDGTPHFRVDSEGKAYGLGVLDMKGGIVIAIWVIKALEAVGYQDRQIKVLLAGDEDKGHFDGDAPEKLTKLSAGSLCCFNMETGRVNSDICIGRKGGGEGEMSVTGVTAHAGNDFASGRNALLEMAYKAIELSRLTDLEKGTTIAPTVIKSGTVPNGIPDYAHMYFDVRYQCSEEAVRVKEGFARICDTVHIEGTSANYIYKEYMPPFDVTLEGERLADLVAEVSQKQGLGAMGKIFLGGSSDACYFTMAGVPTVCAMGVCGQFNHSSKEYALVESLYTRTKLLACTVLDIEKFASF